MAERSDDRCGGSRFIGVEPGPVWRLAARPQMPERPGKRVRPKPGEGAAARSRHRAEMCREAPAAEPVIVGFDQVQQGGIDRAAIRQRCPRPLKPGQPGQFLMGSQGGQPGHRGRPGQRPVPAVDGHDRVRWCGLRQQGGRCRYGTTTRAPDIDRQKVARQIALHQHGLAALAPQIVGAFANDRRVVADLDEVRRLLQRRARARRTGFGTSLACVAGSSVCRRCSGFGPAPRPPAGAALPAADRSTRGRCRACANTTACR